MAQSFITCSHCGKQEDLEIYRRIRHPLVAAMWEKRLCFDCAYWTAWIANPEPDTIVIKNKLYHLECPLEKLSGIYLRGLRNCVYLFDTVDKEYWISKGIAFRGDVPESFRDVIPNRYIFITRKEYGSFLNHCGPSCLSKGCFDRYHCYWYNIKEEESTGPWNIVPDDYVIGSENCPSFIDKNNLDDPN